MAREKNFVRNSIAFPNGIESNSIKHRLMFKITIFYGCKVKQFIEEVPSQKGYDKNMS